MVWDSSCFFPCCCVYSLWKGREGNSLAAALAPYVGPLQPCRFHCWCSCFPAPFPASVQRWGFRAGRPLPGSHMGPRASSGAPVSPGHASHRACWSTLDAGMILFMRPGQPSLFLELGHCLCPPAPQKSASSASGHLRAGWGAQLLGQGHVVENSFSTWGLFPSFKGFAEIPLWKQIPTSQWDFWMGFWMLQVYRVAGMVGLPCVLLDKTGMWQEAAPLPSGSPGKAEDLCPCVKLEGAHQRWECYTGMRVGMCQHCSARHQASPLQNHANPQGR